MLNGTLTLRDVDDAEAFVRAVVRSFHRGGPGPAGGRETEELVAELLAVAWAESERFDDTRSVRFSKHLLSILHRRTTDWYRRRRPGSRYGAALDFVALSPAYVGDSDDADDDQSRRSYGEALRRGDPVADTDRIDVDALSDRGRWTLLTIAVPMAREGYTLSQLAARKTPLNGHEHPALISARRAGDRRELQLAEWRAYRTQARRAALDAGNRELHQALAAPPRVEPPPPSRLKIIDALLAELRGELEQQGFGASEQQAATG
ncbi:MAG: hypothetical protein M3540_09640 [Actinomycetota bacterium]|nr:hypothetical protein [Actinomycetota bacterium]